MCYESLIYMVDDYGDDRAWMVDGLIEAGFKRIREFVNGAQVIEAIKKADELPALIFLDNRLPMVDGFGVMTFIEKYVESGEIKLCLMSEHRPSWFDHVDDKIKILVKEDPFLTREKVKQTAADFLLGDCVKADKESEEPV